MPGASVIGHGLIVPIDAIRRNARRLLRPCILQLCRIGFPGCCGRLRKERGARLKKPPAAPVAGTAYLGGTPGRAAGCRLRPGASRPLRRSLQPPLTLADRSDSIFGPACRQPAFTRSITRGQAMHTFYLGIDVAKAKLDCALRLPDGKFRHKVVDNRPAGFKDLRDWLVKQGADSLHVCMEATGTYWEAVAECLAGGQSTTVSVVNPAQIKAFGASQMVRTKTDKVDAKLIAQFCFERRPAAWAAPTPAEQTLRALVLRLDALQTMRTQESNRLEVARAAVSEGIASHLDWLDKEIERLIKAIHDHIDRDPTLRDKQRLLDSVPGLGERTSPCCWPFMLIWRASTMPARRWPLPASTRDSMSRAAASEPSRACPRSAMPSCARPSTCQPW